MNPPRLFISYSHQDGRLLDRLHKHLAQMEREGEVSGWYDREINAGTRFDGAISDELERAAVFLACVSPDYIASSYCYDKELGRALEREASGSLIIVPVVFEPCDWLATPLASFNAAPKDGKPITEHANENVAFMDIISALRRLLSAKNQSPARASVASPMLSAEPAQTIGRYRVQKEFDELHKRDFVDSGFEEIYRFFEDSTREIESIPDVECRLERPSKAHFSFTVINRGKSRAFETVHVTKNDRQTGIDLLYGERYSPDTSNGGFVIDHDEYQLHFRALYFGHMGRDENKDLSAKQVGQMIWDQLLSQVGIDYA